MSLAAQIVDSGGNGRSAKVTKNGQLVTTPITYDDTAFNAMVVIDTAYNFFVPRAGNNFIITSIIDNNNLIRSI